MENKQPLLSICIPTFNREEILKNNILKLISLSEFDDEVQLVISDNHSTDNTVDTVKEIIKKYPQKNILLHSNEENVKDENFLIVLSKANGIYRKLLNDYIFVSNHTLKLIKSEIKKVVSDKNCSLFFFQNLRECKRNQVGKIEIHNVNDFVWNVNNKSTWISNFGCFDWQLPYLNKMLKYSNLQLLQTIWEFYLVNHTNKTILINISDYSSVNVPKGKRSSYNFFTPHVENYYAILDYYEKQGQISKDTIRFDKRCQLNDFVGGKIFDYLIARKNNDFDLNGSWQIIFKHFWSTPTLYYIIFIMPFVKVYRKFKKNFFRPLSKR